MMFVVLLVVLLESAGDCADGDGIVLAGLGHGVYKDVFTKGPLQLLASI